MVSTWKDNDCTTDDDHDLGYDYDNYDNASSNEAQETAEDEINPINGDEDGNQDTSLEDLTCTPSDPSQNRVKPDQIDV